MLANVPAVARALALLSDCMQNKTFASAPPGVHSLPKEACDCSDRKHINDTRMHCGIQIHAVGHSALYK